ncbi:MAG: homoserine kinase [Azonexus sp.]|nr:homoserine kinase [Azonexus sp.]
MSVYTTVGREELAAWLKPLSVGELVAHDGISAGMQNSNYFVSTTAGRYVLTLFESLDPQALDFYLRLQAYVADAGLPCPHPVSFPEGLLWRPLCGKPAALLSCLPGRALDAPSAEQCRILGAALAKLHLAATGLSDAPENPCGMAWCQRVGQDLLSSLDSSERDLLSDELAFQAAQALGDLPRGVIHADLFRDNVLWDERGQLSGLLDFYFAGVDVLALDLAVVANDWCPDGESLAALVSGYAAIRPLTVAEQTAWPSLRRAAALRFWLLRLEARHRPRSGEVITRKDPDVFRQLLIRLRLAPVPITG